MRRPDREIAVRDLGLAPEPSTYLMLGFGLAGLVLVRRFRRTKA